jgi:hypothetical protein
MLKIMTCKLVFWLFLVGVKHTGFILKTKISVVAQNALNIPLVFGRFFPRICFTEVTRKVPNMGIEEKII